MTKILYVEDEPALGKIVKESLQSRNYEITMAEDGLAGLRAFESMQPDICILDIMLPKMDGYTLAEEIRKTQPKMPIIFLTAKSQLNDVLKGFKVGGNDYLKKPFSLEELIIRIENLLTLTSGQVSNAQEINFGKFKFLPLRYELKCPDNTFKRLSHKEAGILSLLLKHANSTLERKEILLKLWDDDSYFNSRNLDVYITKLRDYLKADPNVEIITIKGIGYYFSY
ncbi:DNA-binding response regulator, OmpR family, contains REC and winged-helix (wHTH) domain [Belliella buryatensis]|uniref:DNA-binding response regulator, OmpR family, contains REC and winged-helix (WHTH) domain n=1 Tax=Belliella buryatensis TaxID=1500549 RepID=A0A239ETT1_9BACT|nr:response regulator transcription factor [Belliella buryatensis]SNS47821.1 DNA-binding response regulator, OmpR family, contains REC and winged-helix (wHTH) domain [Belliella buryatensis]